MSESTPFTTMDQPGSQPGESIPPPITGTTEPGMPIIDTTGQPIPVLDDQPKKRRTRRKAGEPKPPKAPRAPRVAKEKKERKPRVAKIKPGKTASFKDWLRVINSQRNDAPNQRIHIVIDDVNMVATLVTQAYIAEGSTELEPERRQRLKFTTFEVVHGEPMPVISAEPTPVNAAPELAKLLTLPS